MGVGPDRTEPDWALVDRPTGTSCYRLSLRPFQEYSTIELDGENAAERGVEGVEAEGDRDGVGVGCDESLATRSRVVKWCDGAW